MKHWKIASSNLNDTYFIFAEASFWITDQPKGVNIDELIASKKIGDVKIFPYKDIKEIVFIDTDYTIEFVFEDDTTPEERYTMNNLVYKEIMLI